MVGTRGHVELDPAYEYAMELKQKVKIGEKSNEKTFPKRDQFAAEIIYFSDCILRDRPPEPSGLEGLADVRAIEALYRSARIGKPVTIKPISKTQRPTLRQEITPPPVKKPKTVSSRA